MSWRVVGSDVNGRPTFSAAFAGSTAWGIVQEMHDRWAWELNMPDPRDDQRGRAETRLEAQERVMTAARQRGLLEAERIASETEGAAQLAALGGRNGST
jgi:hypothetical protein